MKTYKRNMEGGKVPGTWRMVKRDGEPMAMFSCPKCGFTAGLGEDSHYISSAGIVNPSVVCGNEQCDFHEHIALKGWP